MLIIQLSFKDPWDEFIWKHSTNIREAIETTLGCSSGEGIVNLQAVPQGLVSVPRGGAKSLEIMVWTSVQVEDADECASRIVALLLGLWEGEGQISFGVRIVPVPVIGSAECSRP